MSSNNIAELDRDISICSKTTLQSFIYDYPWEHTIAAYMLRFPKHPILPVLLDSELILDKTDPETRIRTVIRKCMIDIEAPSMFKRAIGVEYLLFTQTTTIDPNKRTMVIINYNETFKDKAVFGDDCSFHVSTSDPNKTEFRQYGFFRLPRLPMAKTCEKLMCKSYDKHSAEGRKIDLALLQESITSGMWKELSALGQNIPLQMKIEHPARLVKPKPQKPKQSQRNGKTSKTVSSIEKDNQLTILRSEYVENTANYDLATFFSEFIWGLIVIVLLPVALGVKHPLYTSSITAIGFLGFLYWHAKKHSDAWIHFLSIYFTTLPETMPLTHENGSSASLPTTAKHNLSEPISKLKAVTFVEESKSNLRLDTEAFDNEEDSESSEDNFPPFPENDEEEDDDIDDEELRDFDEDDSYDSQFLAGNNLLDEELGDLHSMKLRDIKIRIPAFIDKSYTETGLIHFVMEVLFPNGRKRTVLRLYTDFIRLKKHFGKNIPQCKVQMRPTYLPKKKSNLTLVRMSIDDRRTVLQQYVRGLLLDESVAKLGNKVLLEFLRRPGPLFVSTSLSQVAKKKLFGSSLTHNNIIGGDSAQSKIFILFNIPWRSCMRECKLMVEKHNQIVMYTKTSQKDPEMCIFLEDVENIQLSMDPSQRGEKGLSAPYGDDKFAFLELSSNSGDIYFFAGTKDLLVEFQKEIENAKQSAKKQFLNSPRPRKRTLDSVSGSSEVALLMNRKKIWFSQPTDYSKTPSQLAIDLLESILEIFQEYSSSKCVLTPKTQKNLKKFTEQAGQLQLVDFEALSSHPERISFFLNVYHTLIVHSHMDLGFTASASSSKRIRSMYKLISYDIGNFVFSLHDIEHSVLRAKMSRSIMMNDSFRLTPRFKKSDPRNRWILHKPDLRINFVLNSGCRSSIYNVWVFASELEPLNAQLDHAATHFLNEQVNIDYGKSMIYLPRICRYYKSDLGGSKRRILKTLLPYMSVQMEREVKTLIKDEKNGKQKINLKYTDYDWSMRGVFFKGHDISLDDMQTCMLNGDSHKGRNNSVDEIIMMEK